MAQAQTLLPAGVPTGSALDGQPVTEFGGYQFPCAEHGLEGEYRDHIHEYPHRDAGAPEKLGRRLYTVSVRALFYDKLPQFPDLYPFIIDQLQQLFEGGVTSTLVHPSVGSIPAYIRRWSRRREARVRSGETVDITFVEDQQSQFLSSDIADPAHFATIGSTSDNLAEQLAKVQADNKLLLDPPTLSLFSAIQTLANDLSGVRDTSEMYGNLVGARAQQLVNICYQLDSSMRMQDTLAFPLLEPLHNLWAVAQQTYLDSQAKRQTLQTWVVPMTMPLTGVATRLYGDASRTDELEALNANAIPDALSVKAGTPLLYYPPN